VAKHLTVGEISGYLGHVVGYARIIVK